MVKRIAPKDVQLGMYIHGFDGRWMTHPFWRSKFHLTDPDDLERVHNCKVKAVLVDEAKRIDIATRPSGGTVPPSRERITDGGDSHHSSHAAVPRPLRTDVAVAADMRAMVNRHAPPNPNEAPSAAAERAQVMRVIGKSARSIGTSFHAVAIGQALSIEPLGDVIDDIAAAMTTSRATMIGLTRLKVKDEYTYFHSVAVATLMLGLGRQLQLDESIVRDLALGGLLHDVGKMRVAHSILNKPDRLSEIEFAEMRRHPELGHEILLKDPNVPPIALEVTLRHHERVDGNGYPGGLRGDAVSLYARIGAICDVFDALTSVRVYKDGMESYQAIAEMASWEGHFDRDLLIAFMRSIGLYPAGLLVRLSSQRLAIMLPPRRHAGLPRARVIHCAVSNTPLPPCDIVVSDSDHVLSEEQPDAWSLNNWPAVRDQVTRGDPLAAA